MEQKEAQRDLLQLLTADSHGIDLKRMGVLTGLAVGFHNLVSGREVLFPNIEPSIPVVGVCMHMQELFNQVVKECCNSMFEAYSRGRIDKAVLCCILMCCAVLCAARGYCHLCCSPCVPSHWCRHCYCHRIAQRKCVAGRGKPAWLLQEAAACDA